jgi:ABC-type nitrate/sulfonate/bicarbonate transport system ATPase subunit
VTPLKIDHLRFSYPGAPAPTLEDFSLVLPPGEITILMGPSGCGKSTLLRILMGLETGATGTLQTGGHGHEMGHDLRGWNSSQSIFGLVPQVPHLFPWKTVFENIELAAPRSLPAAERASRARAVLDVVQLSKFADALPSAISQGMAARVAFARTLVMDIRAILLDEPFAALDAVTRKTLQDWTRERVRASGMPALFVTHDPGEALALGGAIHVLSRPPARLVLSGQAKELRESDIFAQLL